MVAGARRVWGSEGSSVTAHRLLVIMPPVHRNFFRHRLRADESPLEKFVAGLLVGNDAHARAGRWKADAISTTGRYPHLHSMRGAAPGRGFGWRALCRSGSPAEFKSGPDLVSTQKETELTGVGPGPESLIQRRAHRSTFLQRGYSATGNRFIWSFILPSCAAHGRQL